MKINTCLDFQGNEIKLAAPEKVTTLPDSNLFVGRVCILISEKEVDESTINVGSIYYYNGEQWCNIEGESLEIDETKINVIDDEITLHTFDTSGSAIAYIKSNNKSKSVIIGSNAGVTSIGGYEFYGCESLESITIPSGVTSIGGNAFDMCKSLTSISIPNSVTSIAGYAFHNCKSLKSITIPDSVTSIGIADPFTGRTFASTSLTSISIPSSVTSISNNEFSNCKSLESIYISNGVTSIGDEAFSGCTSLTSISIPSSVTSIGNNAFSGCDILLLDRYKSREGYPWGAKILIQNEDITTTIDENSTDSQVPTAKAVYDNITSIKEDVDTKFDNIAVSNSIGNIENIVNGDDVSYCRGIGEMKYTWDLPSGKTEIGGTASLDYNQIIFPVTPGETIYMNYVASNLTITYFNSKKNYVEYGTVVASDNFVVPSNNNIAYVGIPIKGYSMVGLIFSREPISQDSGDLDAIYMREIRQTNETEYTADYDGTWRFDHGYHRSKRYITTHQDVNNSNKFTPKLYSRTAPDGTVSYYWWEAYYMKRGNCDMSYGNWYQTAFATLTSAGIYEYGAYSPQLYKTSNTVKKIGEYRRGFDILAKTKSGEFLTLDIKKDEITQDLTFGLLLFRNNIGGELGAFSRTIANATDPNATHITNYGTLVNELTNQDGKFFRYKRVKKRITDDYITYTREGDSEPFYKFSITEIKNIIDTNGTIDWNAFTQDELDNWEDGHKEIKYFGNDFDFNVSGIVLYNGDQLYNMQYIKSFASIAPVKTRAYDTAMNSSSSAGSQWKGKKWYAYGTSMTDANYHGYVDRLTNVSGLTCKNFGLGGSGIIPSLHPSDNIKTRCMRTSDGKTEADLITIEIIPNDMSGTLGTSTDTEDTTFCGNLNQILQYLQANTTAQIVVLIATRSRYLYSNTSTKYPPTSEQVTKWMEWVSATEEVCKRNCVQCWDGSSQCGLGYYRVGSETTDTKYVKDQIHLTPLGAKNLADYFWSRLQNLPLFYSS